VLKGVESAAIVGAGVEGMEGGKVANW